MREIISVHVGKAGIEQGIANWDLLAKEYQIDREGSIDQSAETDNYQIFFNENHDGKYKPRAAFIDTDDLIIRDLKESCYKNFFNPNNMKFGKDESAGNFARGMYTVGKEIFDDSFDIVRKMAEAADSLQGIQFYSSSGGGTGGGLGSSLMERATAEFKGVPKIAFVHNPSYQRSTVTTEYYNQILSSQWLNDHTDLVFHISSDRSINLLKNQSDIQCPDYSDLNHLVAQANSGIADSLKSDESFNQDYDELVSNVSPGGQLKFCSLATSALSKDDDTSDQANYVLDGANQLTRIDFSSGKHLSNTLLFRGDHEMGTIMQTVADHSSPENFTSGDLQSMNFTPGVRQGHSTTESSRTDEQRFNNSDNCVTALNNHTGIVQEWDRITTKFDILYAKRAYVHWYVGEGMEEGEFSECRETVESMKKAYKEYEN